MPAVYARRRVRAFFARAQTCKRNAARARYHAVERAKDILYENAHAPRAARASPDVEDEIDMFAIIMKDKYYACHERDIRAGAAALLMLRLMLLDMLLLYGARFVFRRCRRCCLLAEAAYMPRIMLSFWHTSGQARLILMSCCRAYGDERDAFCFFDARHVVVFLPFPATYLFFTSSRLFFTDMPFNDSPDFSAEDVFTADADALLPLFFSSDTTPPKKRVLLI